MTWLDQYAFAIGSRMIRDGMVRTDDVAAAMIAMAQRCMSFAVDPTVPKSERAGFQIEADLYPLFDAALARRRCNLQVTAAPNSSAWRRAASNAERIGFAVHAAERPFTYIDFAPNSYVLAAGIEVQAVFVKAARMVDEAAPRMEPEPIGFELILGPSGVMSRHRLLWRLGSNKVMSAAAAEEPEVFPAVPRLSELLDRAGTTAASIAAEAQDVSMVIVKQASTGARAMPRIPPGDRARRGNRPHPFRSLLQISRVSLDGP